MTDSPLTQGQQAELQNAIERAEAWLREFHHTAEPAWQEVNALYEVLGSLAAALRREAARRDEIEMPNPRQPLTLDDKDGAAPKGRHQVIRTLKDYRPQHDEDCAANYCRRCGKHGDGEIDRTFGEVERCARLYHSFEAKPCSCGLTALLQQYEMPNPRQPLQSEAQTPAWQPIESAPKDGTVVLVALIRDGEICRVSDARFQQIGWYTKNGGIACHWRTHWRPLP